MRGFYSGAIMKRKLKLTKEEWEKLEDEAAKSLYVVDGDAYKIDIDDVEIAAELRRAKDREQARANEAEKKAKDLQVQYDELKALPPGDRHKSEDLTNIEKSWSTKLETAKKESDATIAKLKTQLEKVMVQGAVDAMAAEIFLKPQRDARLLAERVYIDYDGDTPIVRVRDKDGKASALTLADLKKETLDNKEFEDILIGSKASGSGGAGGNHGGGASKKASEYSEQERVALFNSNPTKFHEMFPVRTS